MGVRSLERDRYYYATYYSLSVYGYDSLSSNKSSIDD